MKNNKVFYILQEYYYCLKTANGEWREKPIGVLSGNKTSEDNLKRIKTILNVLLASDKISLETKVYLRTYKVSMKTVNQLINDYEKEQCEVLGKAFKKISYVTCNQRISNEEKDVSYIIDASMLKELAYGTVSSEKHINNRINKLIETYAVFDKQRSNLRVYIDDKKVSSNKCKDSEAFFNKLQALEPYLIQRKTEVEKQISKDTEFIEYFNYLISNASIYDTDVTQDRDRMFRFLSGDSIETIHPEVIVQQEENNQITEHQENNIVESSTIQQELQEQQQEQLDSTKKQSELEQSLSTKYDTMQKADEQELVTEEQKGETEEQEIITVEQEETAEEQEIKTDNQEEEQELEIATKEDIIDIEVDEQEVLIDNTDNITTDTDDIDIDTSEPINNTNKAEPEYLDKFNIQPIDETIDTDEFEVDLDDIDIDLDIEEESSISEKTEVQNKAQTSNKEQYASIMDRFSLLGKDIKQGNASNDDDITL